MTAHGCAHCTGERTHIATVTTETGRVVEDVCDYHARYLTARDDLTVTLTAYRPVGATS